MKFMDKKEQVLDIQMTPYGEYLLSQGKFKPEYYSFYDDNILYESQYSGYADSQNNIEPRTQEDTPQLETQVVFSDRDIFIRRGIDDIISNLVASLHSVRVGGTRLDYTLDQELGEGSEGVTINDDYFERKMYNPQACLGTSDILTTDSPAWSISMIRGEISGSAKAITGSLTPTINIPQLDVTLTYRINVKGSADFISDSELAIQYPNGEYLDIKPEIVLAQIIERNAEFTKENFDIEVFEVQEGKAPGLTDSDGDPVMIEKLRPLKFRKPYSLVQDGILLDSDEIPVSTEPITKEYVEYYFNVKVDSQIDKQLICSSLDVLESRGLYVDTEIECEDVKNIALVDIYTTDAVSDDCPVVEDPCKDTIY
jgi:hypothetical protein